MRVRDKKTGILGFSNRFNVSAIAEIVVGFDDDADGGHRGMDSCYIGDYDVYLESKKEWKDLEQAFRDIDVITDNYNTKFFEPPTEEDRVRGYTLL